MSNDDFKISAHHTYTYECIWGTGSLSEKKRLSIAVMRVDYIMDRSIQKVVII